jgi:hypothetical protein
VDVEILARPIENGLKTLFSHVNRIAYATATGAKTEENTCSVTAVAASELSGI